MQAFTAAAPAMTANHVGFCPGLIDEDKTLGIQPALEAFPAIPTAGDVGSILFAGQHAFF